MGCVSSKDRLQKDHQDHYGFEQSYRQKDIQARHTTSTLPRVKTSTSTLPRISSSKVEGATLERRARNISSQFDPHRDMVIQSLQFRSPPEAGQFRSPPEGGQFRSPPEGGQFRSPPEGGQFRSPTEGGQFRSPPEGGNYKSPNEAQYRGLAEGHARTLERRGHGTSDRKNLSDDGTRWQNNTRRDSKVETTPTRHEKKDSNTETPRRGGDNFDRNKFDRSSQLRRSKKKRKKSSLDQSLSPGVKSTKSEVSPVHTNKTPQGIVTEASPAQSNTSLKSETKYDPKYGNLI